MNQCRLQCLRFSDVIFQGRHFRELCSWGLFGFVLKERAAFSEFGSQFSGALVVRRILIWVTFLCVPLAVGLESFSVAKMVEDTGYRVICHNRKWVVVSGIASKMVSGPERNNSEENSFYLVMNTQYILRLC